MENQHRRIAGYRELSQAEIDLMNEVKAHAEATKALVEKLEARARTQNDVDGRWVSIGRTDLQKGFMSLTRAIARPDSF